MKKPEVENLMSDSLYAYSEITGILERFFIQSCIRILQKNLILACTENTLKAFKRIKRIRKKYFAVYGEYADRHKTEPISANFLPKAKKF
jgi:hypothetical protein